METGHNRYIVVQYQDRRPASKRLKSGVAFRIQEIGKRRRPQNVKGWEGVRFPSYSTCKSAIDFVENTGGTYNDWLIYKRSRKAS